MKTSRQQFEEFLADRDYTMFNKCLDKQGCEMQEYAQHRVQQDWLLWEAAQMLVTKRINKLKGF